MRQVSAVTLGLIIASGCSTRGEQEESKNESLQAVAAVGGTPDVVVAFTTSDHQAQLADIVNGQQPPDFHWIAVRVPAARAAELTSDAGMRADLSDPASPVRFSQVYRDTCNPALENFQPCWLYESYTAGDEGLSGEIILQVKGTQSLGRFDVSWEGNTDRFGPPIQWHRHSSTSGYAATIAGGPQ